jgi:threonine/homoserine/homoserine lactone efflux protein
MTIDQAIAFALFAVVAAITPGPSNIMLAATGAQVGLRRGAPSLFGVVSGMGIMMFIVAFGLGSVALTHPLIQHGLKWCGIGVLLWLAWKIATAGPAAGTAATDAVGFWRAGAFQWVNPKAWLVSASAVGTYLHADGVGALPQALSLALLFVVAALPSCLVWLLFGAAMQRMMRTERAARALNLAMGALLAASVVLFVR